ncbi:6-carboxytetrahydropterin synthase [bacterium]|nr:MAG: 6-carboxytetrahydropterin synthase [bacterium]
MYELTIKRSFVAKHGLRHYQGGTEPIHEHEWHVWITITGTTLDQSGCLIDFVDLNTWFEQSIADWNGKILNEVPPFDDKTSSPSAENVAKVIYNRLSEVVPNTVVLRQIEVEEEPGCRAAYRGMD